MPAIKFTFEVNANVDRWVSYDNGEDPREIVCNLLDESSDEEYSDFLDKIVCDDFKAVSDCYEVTSEITNRYYNITFRADDAPTDRPIPRWDEFMSANQIKRMKAEELRKHLFAALEDATYNDEYDRVIELATQLKKLTDNE